MPQRTSKILLVRLTANKNALLFQKRVTCFARYTVLFGVTRSDQNAVNEYFTLSTITYFDWFPLHTQMEASFGVILLTVYTKILHLFPLFSLITLNDHNPQFLITLYITIRDEHDALLDQNTVRSRFTENTFCT